MCFKGLHPPSGKETTETAVRRIRLPDGCSTHRSKGHVGFRRGVHWKYIWKVLTEKHVPDSDSFHADAKTAYGTSANGQASDSATGSRPTSAIQAPHQLRRLWWQIAATRLRLALKMQFLSCQSTPSRNPNGVVGTYAQFPANREYYLLIPFLVPLRVMNDVDPIIINRGMFPSKSDGPPLKPGTPPKAPYECTDSF